jgi:hypothetical protein
MAASGTKKAPAKRGRQQDAGPSDLEQLEEVLRRTRGKESEFYDQGKALEAIRGRRLYRQTHGTFERYCSDKWDLSRGTAYQLIAAARVVDNVRDSTPERTVPANEAQARPLTRLADDDQREAWVAVVRTAPDGKITAAHVQAVVDDLLGHDEGGKPPKAPRPKKPRGPEIDATFAGRLNTACRSVYDFHLAALGAMKVHATFDRAEQRKYLQAALGEIDWRVKSEWGHPGNGCYIDADGVEVIFCDQLGNDEPTARVDFRLCWGTRPRGDFGERPPESVPGQRRADKPKPSANGTGPARTVAQARAALKKWFRQVSKRYRPGKGGNGEVMKELSAVHEQLQEALGKE